MHNSGSFMTVLTRSLSLCLVLAAAGLSGLLATEAVAATSGWTDNPGGRVRVVIDPSSLPKPGDAAQPGQLRGAVQIDLQPGWKTYWLAPGSGGIPPQINLEGTASAHIEFPVPVSLGEGDDAGLGYMAPVLLPLSFTMPDVQSSLKGNVFLGVCNNICIPVQAEFDFDLTKATSAADNDAQAILARTLVATAFERLPAPASAQFGVADIERDGNQLRLQLNLPDQASPAELFLASDQVEFSQPTPASQNGNSTTMLAQIIGDPRPGAVFYTLVQNGRAVSGKIAMK